MSQTPWYHSLESYATVDDVGAHWHALLEHRQMTPSHPFPAYRDAMLAFAAGCTLAPPLKLASLLAFGSAFDLDLRLALGALLAPQDDSDSGIAWPDAVAAAVSDHGPALPVATTNDWLAAFVAGRFAGLRETMTHDGTGLAAWRAAFWNAVLEMGCRHADEEAVLRALHHGADPFADDGAAIAVAAAGDGQRVLALLLAHGAARAALLARALPAAAAADNVAMLGFLLAQGADLGALGSQALAAAARHMAFGAFEHLLGHGAAIDDGALLAAAAATLDEVMLETVLDAGADPRAGAVAACCAVLETRPWDLYPEKSDFSAWRVDAIALLLRHGAHPAGAAVVAAVQRSRDGARVLRALLERVDLGADASACVAQLAAQAGVAPPCPARDSGPFAV